MSRLVLLTSALAAFLLLFTLHSRTSDTTQAPAAWKVKLPSLQSLRKLGGDSGEAARLRERLDHAEKLWRQSVADRTEMAASFDIMARFPVDFVYPYTPYDFVRPSFYCPHDLERVGTLGDGGKVVCGMTRYERASPGPSSAKNPAETLRIYSFGVEQESSFEEYMIARTNAEVWGYDFSVNSWGPQLRPEHYDRAHFHKAGLAAVTNDRDLPPFYSIQDLMRINGHDYVDIIKMDIEGHEFAVLDSLVQWVDSQANATTLPFGQLLIEIHLFQDREELTLDAFITFWENLERLGLRPVNNEDNWIGDQWTNRPSFMEYTLINAHDPRNKLLWT